MNRQRILVATVLGTLALVGVFLSLLAHQILIAAQAGGALGLGVVLRIFAAIPLLGPRRLAFGVVFCIVLFTYAEQMEGPFKFPNLADSRPCGLLRRLLELKGCQQPLHASGCGPRIPALIPRPTLPTMSGSCATLIPRRLQFHEAFHHRVVLSWTDVIHGPGR